MPFLEALDALPADDRARTELFYQWLRRDWRALFGELRANRPVLTCPLHGCGALGGRGRYAFAQRDVSCALHATYGRLSRSVHAGSRRSGGELARQISHARVDALG